jgi:hypothetical protein
MPVIKEEGTSVIELEGVIRDSCEGIRESRRCVSMGLVGICVKDLVGLPVKDLQDPKRGLPGLLLTPGVSVPVVGMVGYQKFVWWGIW